MAAQEKANLTSGTKPCSVCKQVLPLDQFGQHRRPNRDPSRLYWNSRCRPCVSATTDSRKVRSARLRLRYGVTADEFDAMLAAQGGCAACGSTTTDGKYWHTDHDHACCPTRASSCGKCVRGILCHGCNTALGNAGDDVTRLKLLIDYLERTRRG